MEGAFSARGQGGTVDCGSDQVHPTRAVECSSLELRETGQTPRRVIRSGGSVEKGEQPSSFQYCEPSEVHARLEAAKPIAWRGRGELPTFSWSSLGTWLVIDLWSGIGGTLFACLSLGLRVYAVAIEQDPIAAERTARRFPNVISLQLVEEFHGCMLRDFLKRRTVEGVIVGGGSPCQGNSSLNRHRRGLMDPRSQQPEELQRIRDEIEHLAEARGLRVCTFLENVASTPREVVRRYSQVMSAKPLLVKAAQFGWVQRDRLFWLGSFEDFSSVKLPEGLSVHESDRAWNMTVSLSRPVPASVNLERGFALHVDPKANVMDASLPRLFTFTTEFPHPLDDDHMASAQAVARFREDSGRFPVEAYEDISLAWRQGEWRTLTPSERAAIHCLPPDSVSTSTLHHVHRDRRTMVRNSWVGNGFHIPSLVIVLLLLTAGVRAAPPLQCVFEQHLRETVHGSPFDDSALRAFPGQRSVDQVVDDVRAILADCPGCSEAPWHKVRNRLRGHEIHSLFAFKLFLWHRGLDESTEGPAWLGQRNRALLQAAVGKQRAAGDSKKGLDHLLPPGLAKHEHIRLACSMPSPFAVGGVVDPDLDFAAWALGVWGPLLPQWQEAVRKVLHRLVRAFDPVEEFLMSLSPVAGLSSRSPLALAVFTILLDWPDVTQPLRYFTGFKAVGTIEPTGVFREIPHTHHVPEDEFLGQAAQDFIQEIIHRVPSSDAQTIWDLTQEECDKGWCSGPFSVAQLDSKFGPGRWRPVPRFLITQASGKQRLIDDAKQGSHNLATDMEETIYTIGIDSLPVYVRRLALVVSHFCGYLPEWFLPTACIMDLPEAYRGCPVHPSQRGLTVSATFDPVRRRWCFWVYTGLLYGLASAVLSLTGCQPYLWRLLGVCSRWLAGHTSTISSIWLSVALVKLPCFIYWHLLGLRPLPIRRNLRGLASVTWVLHSISRWYSTRALSLVGPHMHRCRSSVTLSSWLAPLASLRQRRRPN